MKFPAWIITGMLALLAVIPFRGARAYCGDGALETENGEVCDDGNFADLDGCSSYCTFEDLTPPEIISVSIAEGAQAVPVSTRVITIRFSEPLDPLSVTTNTVFLEQQAQPFLLELGLSDDKLTLTITLKKNLISEATHALRLRGLRDIQGNALPREFIRLFKTARFLDRTPPFIVANPPAGEYHFAQNVSLLAYLTEDQQGPAFKDEGAAIYYTLDGSYPTVASARFSSPLTISRHTTLRFFGIDSSGNKSPMFTQVFRFGCGERDNAKRISPYPLCRIQECKKGFNLQNNTCVTQVRTIGGTEDYEDAFTAPLFPSDTPLTVSAKPAIHITAQHRGLLYRPLIFKNPYRENEIHFQKNTFITDESGKAFAGYLPTPQNRYNKEFPIHFGYSFKSIIEFSSGDGRLLAFTPPYKLIVSFNDRFQTGQPVSVFTFDPETEQYHALEANQVITDGQAGKVTITSGKTGLFFIAQPGENFTRAEFKDLEGHWSKNYAEALYRRDIIKGRAKGIYAPDELLTRAEFVKIALESIGAELEETEDSPFPDVPLYAWYAAYLKKAKGLGLIHGYADGNFRPDAPINRAEAIKILITAFGFDLSDAGNFKGEETFSDILPATWYYPTLNFVVKNGLLDGLRGKNQKILDRFGPDQKITRGEMAKLAIKALELKEEKSGN